MAKATTAVKNTEAAEALAQQGFRRAENDRIWDWLKEAHSNAHRSTLAPAAIMPFLSDARLQEGVIVAGDGARLVECTRVLTRDARVFHEKLQALYQRHSQRRGSSVDEDDLFVGIAISQEYLAFIEEYQRVVLPTIEEMIEIFDRAGLDTKSIRATADRGVVYDLAEQASKLNS